jgi:hypothetical protein
VIELPRDSCPVVQDGTRLATSIDKSALVEITIDGVEYRHAMRDLVHGNALRGRELEGANEFFLDLARSSLDQTGRVRAVSYSVRVARMGGDQRPRIAVLVHVKEYAAGHRAASNRCSVVCVTESCAEYSLLASSTTNATELSGKQVPGCAARILA